MSNSKSFSPQEVQQLLDSQRAFFNTGVTLDVAWRKEQLRKLKAGVKAHEQELIQGICKDLGRSETEAYLTDVGMLIMEINEALRGLRRWARPESHFSGIPCFPSIKTKVYKMPYGATLIMSPYNFPVLLSLGPLVAAIAGGNTAMLKVSSKSPASGDAIAALIEELFPPEYVTVVGGSREVAEICLDLPFDKIFYTGSPRVGSYVMGKAAQNLTPVALELGGETGNWCIVRKDADIKDAARKIAWFKMLNAGQICVNVNQVAVAQEVAEGFIQELKNQIAEQMGEKPLENSQYPWLINDAAFEKCAQEAQEYQDRIVHGGKGDPKTRRFEPTIIYPVDISEPIVQHELFCPLLPLVPFKDEDIDELLAIIAQRQHGLALYLFTKDKAWAKKIMQSQQYGGGCINDVCMQLAVKDVPFNGVGHSGMGAYHGEWGFREFTHPSTVLMGSSRCNVPIRFYPMEGPKASYKNKLLHKVER